MVYVISQNCFFYVLSCLPKLDDNPHEPKLCVKKKKSFRLSRLCSLSYSITSSSPALTRVLPVPFLVVLSSIDSHSSLPLSHLRLILETNSRNQSIKRSNKIITSFVRLLMFNFLQLLYIGRLNYVVAQNGVKNQYLISSYFFFK